jgi:hypothetical protein
LQGVLVTFWSLRDFLENVAPGILLFCDIRTPVPSPPRFPGSLHRGATLLQVSHSPPPRPFQASSCVLWGRVLNS